MLARITVPSVQGGRVLCPTCNFVKGHLAKTLAMDWIFVFERQIWEDVKYVMPYPELSCVLHDLPMAEKISRKSHSQELSYSLFKYR